MAHSRLLSTLAAAAIGVLAAVTPAAAGGEQGGGDTPQAPRGVDVGEVVPNTSPAQASAG